MCLDQESCGFISYFDATAAPIAHFCQLFSSCDTTTSCSDCVSENMACYRSCSENIVGVLDDNVLDVVPNIDSETDCKQSCLNSTGCSYFTFFLPNSTLFHNYCFLQSEFVGPAQPCPSCVTGPVDCFHPVGCSLALDGESRQG